MPSAPAPDICYQLPSVVQPLNLALMFPANLPLEVELGAGDGSFLVAYAQAHPERHFLGIERLLGRLQKIERKARQAGLANLRAIRIESSYLLQYLLPEHSVSALHIYFPDPWPKRKHRRHRLINEGFPSLAQRVLTQRGELFLRTDDADYFSQMRAVMGGSPLFEPVETPAGLAEMLTDFEREFRAQGRETLRAAYRVVIEN